MDWEVNHGENRTRRSTSGISMLEHTIMELELCSLHVSSSNRPFFFFMYLCCVFYEEVYDWVRELDGSDVVGSPSTRRWSEVWVGVVGIHV